MNVLVTGGSGFIGSHLVDRLLADGHRVRVLDNLATGRRSNLAHVLDDVELQEGDIRSYEQAHRAMQGIDVAFHQAALPSVPRSVQDPLTSDAVNVTGTLNLLLAARDSGVGRFIFASSSSVYGDSEDLPRSERHAPLPFSPYAVAKLAGEGYCRAFARVYGLDTVVLRYFNVFGPRQDPLSQYAAVIPHFVTAALRDEPPEVHGDGEQSRDFTYVENVAEANLRAMAADERVAGRMYNIAAGERTTLNQVLLTLGEIVGHPLTPNYVASRKGDVRHSEADIADARADLGYEVQVPLAEGLARAVEHYRTAADGGHPAPLGVGPGHNLRA
jgi:nucleoside-diphosphate-sugar epimerase